MVEWSRHGIRNLAWLVLLVGLAFSPVPAQAAQQEGSRTWEFGDLLLTARPPEGLDGQPVGTRYLYDIEIMNRGGNGFWGLTLQRPDGFTTPAMNLGSYGTWNMSIEGWISLDDVASRRLTIPAPGFTLIDGNNDPIGSTGEFSFPFEPPASRTEIALAPVFVAPAACDEGVYQPPSITMPPASDTVSYWLEPATTGFAPGQAFTAYAQWNPDLYTAITDGRWILAGEPGYASQAIALPGCWAAGLLAGIDPATASFSFAGETIDYAITATNGGEATVSGLSTTSGEVVATSLLPGESAIIATGVHEVTAADIENGHITLTATITGVDAVSGPVKVTVEMRLTYLPPPPVALPLVPDWAEASCDGPTPGQATIALPVDENGLITFTADPPGEAGMWFPGQVVTITATLPEGRVFGDLAEGWDPDPDDPARATFVISLKGIDCVKATISLAKRIVDGQPAYAAGETVRYELVAANTGNVDLAGVVVTDDLVDDLACDGDAVAPDKEITCTASYTVSQQDIDDGEPIINLAAVTGTAPDGTTQASDTASVVAHVEGHAPAISLVQSAAPDHIEAAGQEIAYTFTVANDGNVTLSDIAIDAQMLAAAGRDITCAASVLAPTGQTVCTATLIIGQRMMDDGTPISSVATASATLPGGGTIASSQATTEVPIHQRPEIGLEKVVIRVTSAGVDREIAAGDRATGLHAGDTVTYAITATNDGNVTLRDVTVRDEMLADLHCQDASSLDPGGAVACTGTYTLEATDAARWPGIVNTASVAAIAPNGQAISESASVTIWPAVPAPSLEITLTPDRERYATAGDVIGYAIAVKNTGSVAVTGLQLSSEGFAIDPGCEMPETLEPGEPFACDGEHEITQADLDAGSHIARVTITGEGPDGAPVTSPVSTTTVGDQNPALGFSARISEVNGVPVSSPVSGLEVGDVVTYALVAANTGNVTLTDASITDSLLGDRLDCAQPVSIAPGSSLTCTAIRSVTQGDVDRGDITSEASAIATAPDHSSLLRDAAIKADTVAAAPGLGLVTLAPPDAAYRAGDVLAWSFEVTNTGNVTVTDLAIHGSWFDIGPIICPETMVKPGDAVTCGASMVITQSQIDYNTPLMHEATATGLAVRAGNLPPPKEPVDPRAVSAGPVPSEVGIVQAPALTLTMTATTPPGREIVPGTIVTWDFLVGNSGNITLSEVIFMDLAVSDMTRGGSGPLTFGTLAPGESARRTGTSVVSADDIKAGGITNEAVAMSGPVWSPEATLTLPLAGSGIPAPTPTPSPPTKPTPTPTEPANPAPDPSTSEPTPSPTPAAGAPADPDPTPPAGNPAPGEDSSGDGDPGGNDPAGDGVPLVADPEITALPATGRGASPGTGWAWFAALLAALVLAPAALRLRHHGEE